MKLNLYNFRRDGKEVSHVFSRVTPQSYGALRPRRRTICYIVPDYVLQGFENQKNISAAGKTLRCEKTVTNLILFRGKIWR